MIDEEMFKLLDRLGLLGAYLRFADPYGRMRRADCVSKEMADILSAQRKRCTRKEKKRLLKAIREGKL